MSDKLIGKDPDELTLIIANREIILESAKFLRTMDTCADALTGIMPWEPGLNEEIDDITSPYNYNEAKIYIGGELQMTGLLYNTTHRRDINGTVKELEIYTQTANMIDSSVRWPFEENNIKLDARCRNQATKFGIDIVLDEGVDIGGKFSRISAKQTDKCFEHLKKLAWQRGLLLSCTKYGELLIIKPNVDGTPVGTLEEENPLTENYEISFNGRERFYRYEAITTSSKKTRTKIRQRALDEIIPANRFLTFTTDESLPGEGLNAALWRRNKSAADALSMSFPVNSWYAPDKTLWQVNTTITIKSDIMSLKNGFTFLITQIEFNYTTGGSTAILSLKPPSLFTTGNIEEPWISE